VGGAGGDRGRGDFLGELPATVKGIAVDVVIEPDAVVSLFRRLRRTSERPRKD